VAADHAAITELLAPWWTWTPEKATLGDSAYRWFNLSEAAAWFVFAVLVLNRWRQNRCSALEPAYGAAFVAFGLTDVAEAWQQSLALLTLKGAVLAMLLLLRQRVRRQCYPGSRGYPGSRVY
jgi:hypothetical protein